MRWQRLGQGENGLRFGFANGSVILCKFLNLSGLQSNTLKRNLMTEMEMKFFEPDEAAI